MASRESVNGERRSLLSAIRHSLFAVSPLAPSRRRALAPLAAGDLGGGDHGLGAALDAELLQDRGHMGLDGGFRDAGLIGDLLVEQAFRQHHQHPHLLRGQRHQPVAQARHVRVGGGGEIGVRRHPDVAVHHLGDRVAQRIHPEPLGNEPGGAEVERAADGADVVAGRYDHDRHRRILRAQVNQAGKARDSRHGQVEQDQVDIGFPLQKRGQFLERSGFIDLGTGHDAGNRLAQRIAKQRMVVGNDQMGVGEGSHVSLLRGFRQPLTAEDLPVRAFYRQLSPSGMRHASAQYRHAAKRLIRRFVRRNRRAAAIAGPGMKRDLRIRNRTVHRAKSLIESFHSDVTFDFPHGTNPAKSGAAGEHCINEFGERTMTMAATAGRDLGSKGMTGAERMVIFASSLGTVFEWYDFYLYGWTAAQIGKAFYSAFDANTQFIFALLTFAAGFLVRPFGALVFGRVGDLVGRKYTFLVTITIMGLSTFLVGLTPGYAAIGWLAPAILIFLRCLQGLALGGEYGGAATYVAEHAPHGRRGFYTSWIQTTATVGLFLSLIAVYVVRNSMTPEGFGDAALTGGWRIPYLLPIILLGISIWIRLQLAESPMFQKMKNEGTRSKAPLTEAFGNWRNGRVALIALLGLVAGEAVIWYGGQFYARVFLVNTLKVPANSADIALIVALIIATVGFLFFGWLSDKIGRKPIILAGCLLGALTYHYAFSLLTHA